MTREQTHQGIWGKLLFLPATAIGRKLGKPFVGGMPVTPDAVEWGGQCYHAQVFHDSKTQSYETGPGDHSKPERRSCGE
jgi:hypothetical protein